MGIRIKRKAALAAVIRAGAAVTEGAKHRLVSYGGRQTTVSKGTGEADMPPWEAKRLAAVMGLTVAELKRL